MYLQVKRINAMKPTGEIIMIPDQRLMIILD